MKAKRVFDLVCTIPGFIILAPVFAFVALWIKFDSPGPVFFRQERVGLKGKHFRMIKFRTMVQDASQKGLSLTVGEDPRITRSGRILRKYKLDELPQLINVIMGDMSLVGPRPEVPYYVAMYSKEQRRVLDLIPGITDPASIKFRNESEILAAIEADGNEFNDPEQYYVNRVMPEKIYINLEYAKGSSIRTDFVVILKTLFGF